MTPALQFDANYSYIHMKETISGTPTHKLFASATYQVHHWDYSVMFQYINRLYLLSQPNPKTETYGLLDAKLGYSFNKGIHVFLKAENVLNQSYQVIYGYPMPGITVFAGVHFNFNTHLK